MKTIFKWVLVLLFSTAITSCHGNTKASERVFADNHKKNTTKSANVIKVALLLDTSNSMDGLIDQAKAQLWEIVNELSYAKCDDSRPSLQIALYEYGNDNLSSAEGYIRLRAVVSWHSK